LAKASFVLVSGLGLVLALSGCAGDDQASAAGRAAGSFTQAVADQDGARACSLLSPATADSVADDGSCAGAVLKQDLPTVAKIQKIDREGRSAFVVTDDDTMFLSQFPDGWKIIGAGCTEQGSAPYDCTVSGG
jgi:hypothetical protein